MEMFRQGDMLITRITCLPEGLTTRQSQVILEGEATGHTHQLTEGRVLENTQGMLFLEVLQKTQVVHEEHHALVLEPGFYRVTRQREYTPDSIRNVMD